MWKKVYIKVWIVAFILVACEHNGNPNYGEVKEYSLKHSFCGELMMTSGRMQLVDSFLVIVSHEQDKICSIYEIGDGDKVKVIADYGAIGVGPKEFVRPLLTGAYRNEFTLNEINTRELALLSIEKSQKGIFVKEKSRLKDPYKPAKGELVLSDICFTRLDDEHFVSITSSGNGCFFTLSDRFLQPILRFGDSPIMEDLSPIASRNRLGGSLATFEGTMVYAASKLPYMASYSWEKGTMKKNWSFFYDETNYAVSNGDLLFDREKAIGPVLDLKVDSEYIYVCYLDQLLGEYDFYDTKKSCSDKILIFDHQGKKHAVIHLDCRINEMVVDRERGFLLAITQEPDMSLVKFQLPEGL